MKYYSIDEQTNEVLLNTLRFLDYLDNVTPSYPIFSIIHDAELPTITDKQAYVVVGGRSSYHYTKDGIEITINNVFLTSQNIEVVEDHRGEKYFRTTDGSEIEVKELGPLPDHITDQPKPDEFYKWNGTTWVEDQTAQDEATQQMNIAKLAYETQRVTQKIDTIKPAIDGGYADDEDVALLPLLNKYRYQLSKVVDQIKWPLEVDWPKSPEF